MIYLGRPASVPLPFVKIESKDSCKLMTGFAAMMGIGIVIIRARPWGGICKQMTA